MVELESKPEKKTRKMPLYKVIFHNDDVTSFGFVIGVLMGYFNKSAQDAEKLAVEVHETGSGLAGIYTLELAELKKDQTISLARAYKFPLYLTLEKA